MKKATKLKLVIGIIIGFVILGFMLYKINTQNKEKVYEVKAYEVKSVASFDSVYSASGNVELRSGNIHAVTTEYNAQIEEVYVENGQRVAEDEALLKLRRLSDDTEIILYADNSGTVKFKGSVYKGTILPQYTTVMTIGQLTGADDFYVKVQIPASVYDNMSSLSSADVTFPNSLSELKLTGTPDKASIQAEQVSNTDYYNINVTVNDSDAQLADYNLLDGMGVNVVLHAESELSSETADSTKNYFEVPFCSIVTRNDDNVVFICQNDEYQNYKARMIVVELLHTNGDTAVVRVDKAAPMSSSSFVITQGNYNLSGSEKIKIQ